MNLPAKYMGQKFGEVLLHNYASSGIAHVTAAGYMRLLLYAMCHTCLITSASVSSLSQAADIPTPLRPQLQPSARSSCQPALSPQMPPRLAT